MKPFQLQTHQITVVLQVLDQAQGQEVQEQVQVLEDQMLAQLEAVQVALELVLAELDQELHKLMAMDKLQEMEMEQVLPTVPIPEQLQVEVHRLDQLAMDQQLVLETVQVKVQMEIVTQVLQAQVLHRPMEMDKLQVTAVVLLVPLLQAQLLVVMEVQPHHHKTEVQLQLLVKVQEMQELAQEAHQAHLAQLVQQVLMVALLVVPRVAVTFATR